MINTLPSPKNKQKGKKIGRGMGSGVGGHTSGRGGKGQTARGGHKKPSPNFEGGQNPINRRLPRFRGLAKKGKGFTANAYLKALEKNVPIKLSILASAAKENKLTDIDMTKLAEMGLIRPQFNKDLIVKVLFDKNIDYSLNLKGIETSKTAKAAIEKAGGKVEQI